VYAFQVKQREEEIQCSKMVLRFREDKIKRMETLSGGVVITDTYLTEERNAALKELQLLRDEKGRNPEVTKLAMENMRLQEQLRKYVIDGCCKWTYDTIFLGVTKLIREVSGYSSQYIQLRTDA